MIANELSLGLFDSNPIDFLALKSSKGRGLPAGCGGLIDLLTAFCRPTDLHPLVSVCIVSKNHPPSSTFTMQPLESPSGEMVSALISLGDFLDLLLSPEVVLELRGSVLPRHVSTVSRLDTRSRDEWTTAWDCPDSD